MSSRDVVKQYFLTGSYPTQNQFWDLFDKIVFKDESLTSLRIEGAAGQAQIAIPGKAWVDKIGFFGTDTMTVDCGKTLGGNDVFEQQDVTNTQSVNTEVYFPEAGNLYFTGITPTTKIIIFYR